MKNIIPLIAVLVILATVFATANPQGVIVTSNSTVTPPDVGAASVTTTGGSFTTLVLNGTFQNPRWKAFVGNITGTLTLDDALNQTIYDWDLTVVTGEVYASRSSSINWNNIACADNATLNAEEAAISFNSSKIDSINNTFNTTTHAGFLVAGVNIPNSNCRAIATYIDDQRQTVDENADFQQILLDDDSELVYATILEVDEIGYDGNSRFDFQMILPDEETAGVDTTYYFYAEIG
jgi:hypothetical protein